MQRVPIIRGPNKHRINADYIQRKRKRRKHLPAVTLPAVRSMGNLNHDNTRVLLQYIDDIGVSVFVVEAPWRRNDYVSLYAVKKELTGDQYRVRYPVGVTSLTEEHRRDKVYNNNKLNMTTICI